MSMTKIEVARAFVERKPGRCHNASTGGDIYTPDTHNPMTIVTNWAPRDMVAKYELPVGVRKDFDYAEDDDYSARYVQYKGEWYDAYDTQRIVHNRPDGNPNPMGWAMAVHPDSPLGRFDAMTSDTFFSGMLFKFVGDSRVIVARYYA